MKVNLFVHKNTCIGASRQIGFQCLLDNVPYRVDRNIDESDDNFRDVFSYLIERGATEYRLVNMFADRDNLRNWARNPEAYRMIEEFEELYKYYNLHGSMPDACPLEREEYEKVNERLAQIWESTAPKN
ncbi:MAG: hypothetical protein HY514_05000 [Candidatus Aenigmarchaeota archaeon]|nr:hypothetical protein [Candidatus Aenigmarchaeota archaeon]